MCLHGEPSSIFVVDLHILLINFFLIELPSGIFARAYPHMRAFKRAVSSTQLLLVIHWREQLVCKHKFGAVESIVVSETGFNTTHGDVGATRRSTHRSAGPSSFSEERSPARRSCSMGHAADAVQERASLCGRRALAAVRRDERDCA
jgi:hypothetical protein